MTRPKDPEEQRAFLVDFMPGGHPVILGEQDEGEVSLPPHRQILAEAMYDPETVPTSDIDFGVVMEAIKNTGNYKDQWSAEEARRVAQLALAFSQVQRPEESDEQ